jgi:hypothetical protein
MTNVFGRPEMLSQVPVYLGKDSDQLIGAAEIIDDKEVIIHFNRDSLINAIKDLVELNQIRGIYIDLQYMPPTFPAEVTRD